MIKYLMFKKTINNEAVVKIIPVVINSEEIDTTWALVGSCDKYIAEEQSEVKEANKKLEQGSKFQSPVSGSARLIRSKGVIKIAYRRGKNTRDITQPDSVCINDVDKQRFFNAVRAAKGTNPSSYDLKPENTGYSTWNKFIDNEYAHQLAIVNNKLGVKD